MRKFLKRLFGNKEVPMSAEMHSLYERRECPNCKCKDFFMGPHGGMAQNIECVGCGNIYNVGPFDDQWLGMPMHAELVGWNGSGRWLEKGKLKIVEENRKKEAL